MQCHRCHAEVPTRGLAPGTALSCPNCRTALGQLGGPKRTTTRAVRKVPIPARRDNYTGWIVTGVVIVAVALVAYFAMQAPPKVPPIAKKPKAVEPEPPLPPPPPPPPPVDTPPKPKTKSISFAGQTYEVPVEFVKGADKHAGKAPPNGVPPLAADDKKPWETFPSALAQALSDDEKLARAAFEHLDQIAVRYRMPGLVPGQEFRVNWDFFNDPRLRGTMFDAFAAFEPALQKYWAKEKAGMDPFSKDSVLASEADWDKLIVQLRGYQLSNQKGAKYVYEDVPDSLGKVAFEKIQRMGKQAHPYLIKYILDSDPQNMRTAIVVLSMLTGYSDRIPKPSEARKAFDEWLANCALTESQIPK